MTIRSSLRLCFLAFCISGVVPHAAPARVIDIEIEQRTALQGGRSFGASGAYEMLVGRVRLGIDPAKRANARVSDLAFAPRSADGLVEATATFMILQPVDPALRRGTGLFGIANRGRRLEMALLNRIEGRSMEPVPFDPEDPADTGDGFLMERGMTVGWVGWQADAPTFPGSMNIQVPRARNEDGSTIVGLARSDWVVDEATAILDLAARGHRAHRAAAAQSNATRLTRRPSREGAREEVPRNQWRFDETRTRILPDSVDEPHTPNPPDPQFEAGWIYELVYVAEDPPIVGLGFTALRDFASYARFDPTSPFAVSKAVVMGISQSGRFLRNFLYEGFNSDESTRRVFDGAIVQIAGAGRGGFNHRFSHPGRVGNPFENFFYPGDDFPFTSRALSFEGVRDGLLENERASGALPRVMQINTGYEYWGRAASLVHMTPDGREDVAPLANERLYHIASAPHYSLPFPPMIGSEVRPGMFRGSSIDTSFIHRALLDHMLKWVESGVAPPPSRIPKISDGTLVEPSSLVYPIDELRRPRSPHVAYRLMFGPRFQNGIVDHQPPKRSTPYGIRVPAIDPLGSEATGIRLLELRAPIGTYTPWALRLGHSFAQDEMLGYIGTFLPLPCESSPLSEDRRASFRTHYPSQADYETSVDQGLSELIAEGSILAADRSIARDAAMERWRWMNDVRCASADSD